MEAQPWCFVYEKDGSKQPCDVPKCSKFLTRQTLMIIVILQMIDDLKLIFMSWSSPKLKLERKSISQLVSTDADVDTPHTFL